MKKIQKLQCNNLIYLLLFSLGTIVLYGHTLDIPWYLDDYHAILENKALHNVDLNQSIRFLFRPRGIADITLSWNYLWWGDDPFWYHVINLFLHTVNTFLVFLILQKLFNFRKQIAAFGAIIFLAHPIQTQAVNYIVQRSVLLATLFALLAIIFFFNSIKARNKGNIWRKQHLTFYILSILFFLASVATKQNTATLPLIMLAVDRLTSRDVPFKTQIAYIAPFILIPVMIALPMLILPILTSGSISNLAITRELANLEGATPLLYFATEMQVFFIYLKLFLFPIGLKLDYGFPIAENIITLKNTIFLFMNLAVIVTAFKFRKKNTLVCFGILWFYLALAVESTFIPLDPIFEHRLYFPIIGPIILVCSLFSDNLNKTKVALFILITVTMSMLTWQRNDIWRTPIAFTEDNAEKSPQSEGVWVSLSYFYLEQDRFDDAIAALNRAKKINPKYPKVYINLSSALIKNGNLDSALNAIHTGLLLTPEDSKLMRNLSLIYSKRGQHQESLKILRQLILKQPQNSMLHALIGKNLLDMRMWAESERYFLAAIRLDSSTPGLYYFLGITQYQQKNYNAAIKSLQAELQRNPEDSKLLLGLGMISLESGEMQNAYFALARLKKIDPRAAAELQSTMIKQNKLPQQIINPIE